jgi:hypothetical protein
VVSHQTLLALNRRALNLIVELEFWRKRLEQMMKQQNIDLVEKPSEPIMSADGKIYFKTDASDPMTLPRHEARLLIYNLKNWTEMLRERTVPEPRRFRP